MVDECGDEVKVETFNVGNDLDEDYMELWKDRKIEKARANYPEAQRFYFERPYSDMSYGELLACGDFQKIGVINMDFYGWRIKEWRFNSSNIEEKQQEMKNWIEKWQHKYRIEQIYVNNAWAVQYRLLMKVG